MPTVAATMELVALAPPIREIPEKMYPPSPGPRAYAAMAAMPISICAETRTPVMITGQASGSSSRSRVANRLMPMPRADSTRVLSTPLRPTTTLRRIGKTPKNTSRITDGRTPEADDADQDTEQGVGRDGQPDRGDAVSNRYADR